MAVEDGGERAIVSGVEGGFEGFAQFEFFAQAFVDEDVSVDAHADGEDDTRDAEHGQRRVGDGHESEEDDGIDQQAEDGDEAGGPVVGHHEEEDAGEADHAGEDALFDGIGTEAGGDAVFVDDFQRVFQRVVQSAGQFGSFFFGE